MGDTPQPRVLIVEDNELVTAAMQILLESAGWRPSSAHSLAEARALIESEVPRLALIDLGLPDGSGLSLIPALKAVGCDRVVALTGDDDPVTRQKCLAAGCTDVLVKPVPARELVAKSVAWRNA
ncbi:MAG TPA: response regulator [Gemmatimonadaceae bacterium]|nr:response regulator [Gemmatimonadaceae bacterium]